MNSDERPVKIIVDRTIKYENGRIKHTPIINVEDYDDITGPIEREIANFDNIPLHPGTDCELGDPKKCSRYDIIAQIFKKYKKNATRTEMKMDHNAPDLMYFIGMPLFCQVCWEHEHERRKKANTLWKRIKRFFTWPQPKK